MALDVLVTFQAKTDVSNGRGGLTPTWANAAGLTALRARMGYKSPNAYRYKSVGGGQVLEVTEFIVFYAPYPAALNSLNEKDYRAVVNGVTYDIHKVRRYEKSVQIDVRDTR
jgi:hypothetical protein